MSEPAVVRELAELRRQVGAWRRHELTIALVPTMGALHEGHLALVRHALDRCDRVVVSIFVNPTQFAPHEDFKNYPRTFDSDRHARLSLIGRDGRTIMRSHLDGPRHPAAGRRRPVRRTEVNPCSAWPANRTPSLTLGRRSARAL